MTQKRGYKRRKFFIDNFQYRLIGVILIHFLTILAVFAGTVFLPLIAEMESTNLNVQQREQLADEFLALHGRLWPALAVVLVLVIVHSVITSHRIAGPIFRLRKMLGVIGKGDFTVRAVFRRDDYLAKEASSVNVMVAALREMMTRLRTNRTDAAKALSDLRSSFSNGTVEEMERKSELVATHLNEMRELMRAFRIDEERDPAQSGGGDASESEASMPAEHETPAVVS